VKGNVSGISWSILPREVENVLLLMWKKLEVVQILAQRKSSAVGNPGRNGVHAPCLVALVENESEVEE